METRKRVEQRSNGIKHTFKLIGQLLPNQKDPKSIAFKKANFKGSYWIDNPEELILAQVEEGNQNLLSISININTYFSLKEKVFKTTLTYLESTVLDVTEVQQGTELIADPIKARITDVITCELRGHYLIKFYDAALDTVIWAKWYGEKPIKDRECSIELNLTKTKYLYDRDGQMFEVTKKISFELDNEQVERNVNRYFTILEVKKLNYVQ